MSVFSSKLTAGEVLVQVLRTWGSSNTAMRQLAKTYRVTDEDYLKQALTAKGDKKIELVQGEDRTIWSMARAGKRALQLNEPSRTSNYNMREELMCLHAGAFTGQVPREVDYTEDLSSRRLVAVCDKNLAGAPVYIEHRAISKSFEAMLGRCKAIEVQFTKDQIQSDVQFYGEAWFTQLGQTASKAMGFFKANTSMDAGLEMIQRSYALRSLSRAISLRGRYTKWKNVRGLPVDAEIHLTPFVMTMKLVNPGDGSQCIVILGKDDLSHLIRMVFCTGIMMCIKAADDSNLKNKDLLEELRKICHLHFKYGKSTAWALRQIRAAGLMTAGGDEAGKQGTLDEASKKDPQFREILGFVTETSKNFGLDLHQQLAFVDLHRVLPPQHVDPIKAAAGYILEDRDPHIEASVDDDRIDRILEKQVLHYLNAIYQREKVWPGSSIPYDEAKKATNFDERDWDAFIAVYSRSKPGMEQRWVKWINIDCIFSKYLMPAEDRTKPAFQHFAKDSSIPSKKQMSQYHTGAKLSEKNYALNLMGSAITTEECCKAVTKKAQDYKDCNGPGHVGKTQLNVDIKSENHKFDDGLRLFFITPPEERVANSMCMDALLAATDGYAPLSIGEGAHDKSDFREAIKTQKKQFGEVTRLSSDARKWSRSWLKRVIEKLRRLGDRLLFGKDSLLTDMMYMFDNRLTELIYQDNYCMLRMSADVYDYEGMAGVLLSHFAIANYDVSLEEVAKTMQAQGHRLVGSALLKIFIDDALSCSAWQPPLKEAARNKFREEMAREMVKGNIWLHTKKTPVSNTYDVFTDSENLDDYPIRNPVKVIFKLGATDLSPIASYPEKIAALLSNAQAAGWQNLTTKQCSYIFSLLCKFEAAQWVRNDSEMGVVKSKIFLAMLSMPHAYGGAAIPQLGEIHFTGVGDKLTEMIGRYRAGVRGSPMVEGPQKGNIQKLLKVLLARPIKSRSFLATFRSPTSISTTGPAFREHTSSYVVRQALKRLGDKVMHSRIYVAEDHDKEEAYYHSYLSDNETTASNMRDSVQSALLIVGAYRLSKLAKMDKVVTLITKSKFVVRLLSPREKRRVQRSNMVDFVRMVAFYKSLTGLFEGG